MSRFKSSRQVSYAVNMEKSNLDLPLTTWASEMQLGV